MIATSHAISSSSIHYPPYRHVQDKAKRKIKAYSHNLSNALDCLHLSIKWELNDIIVVSWF